MSARTQFPPGSSYTSEIEIPWLTVREVAAELRVSVRTIQRLVAPAAGKHRLLAARVGGSIRIRRETLDNYLRAREAYFEPFEQGGGSLAGKPT
jgi:excisionase family DNA binding protein